MKILINCTGIKTGGGLQVTLSFINNLNNLGLDNQYLLAISKQINAKIIKDNFSNNFIFYSIIPSKKQTIINRNKLLKQIEKEQKPDIVFSIFGPSYYKSKVKNVVGFAIPHYIYKESPFFKKITIKDKINSLIYRHVKIFLFKRNSNFLIFETNDVRNRFCELYNYPVEKTQVVYNTLNQIFVDKKTWSNKKFDFKSKCNILVLSAYYPHKNIEIIPKVIDVLISKYQFTDFKFILSLKKETVKFEDKYDKYIDYLGTVSLDDLPRLYNAVDISFIPTLLECFSATYLESMFMNVPIVASDMSFARDICEDSAIYYSPISSSDAADKIMKLVKNDNERLKLIKNGQDRIKQFPNSMDRTNMYLKILEELK